MTTTAESPKDPRVPYAYEATHDFFIALRNGTIETAQRGKRYHPETDKLKVTQLLNLGAPIKPCYHDDWCPSCGKTHSCER